MVNCTFKNKYQLKRNNIEKKFLWFNFQCLSHIYGFSTLFDIYIQFTVVGMYVWQISREWKTREMIPRKAILNDVP